MSNTIAQYYKSHRHITDPPDEPIMPIGSIRYFCNIFHCPLNKYGENWMWLVTYACSNIYCISQFSIVNNSSSSIPNNEMKLILNNVQIFFFDEIRLWDKISKTLSKYTYNKWVMARALPTVLWLFTITHYLLYGNPNRSFRKTNSRAIDSIHLVIMAGISFIELIKEIPLRFVHWLKSAFAAIFIISPFNVSNPYSNLQISFECCRAMNVWRWVFIE